MGQAHYRISVCFLFFMACNVSFTNAQQLKTIDFRTFVRESEIKGEMSFYYTTAQLDTVKIRYRTEDDILDAFKEAFLTLDYHLSVDSITRRVFITQSTPILTDVAFYRKALRTPTSEGDTTRMISSRHVSSNEFVRIGNPDSIDGQNRFLLRGITVDQNTQKPVEFARVYVGEGLVDSALTTPEGQFELSVSPGRNTITVRSFGKAPFSCQIMAYADVELTLLLTDQENVLDEVIVNSEALYTERPQLGVEKLTIQTIKQIPTVFGEADVTRVLLTLPGVQTVGEAANGFNVRGGATDQNLVLLDRATIFNSSHLFGFFSAFNPDVIAEAELYKSSIPAKYGGRIASVLEVKEREPNRQKFSGSGGIGPLTGRLTLEGPLDPQTSLLLAGRTTYSDWLLNLIPEDQYNNGSARFYDANFILKHHFNDRWNISASGYLSNDHFAFSGDTTYGYRNQHANLNLFGSMNDQLEVDFSIGYDGYAYEIQGEEQEGANHYQLDYNLQQFFFRNDFRWRTSQKHVISFGLNSILYQLKPGALRPSSETSLVQADALQMEKGLETALYIGDEWNITERLTMDLGLRYVMFNNIGSQTVNLYAEGLPISTSNIIGSTSYQNGEFYNTYHAPEFRLAMQQLLSESSSVKLGFNNVRQYIHMLSNTTAITPADSWKLSDQFIKPLNGYQASLGFYKNYNNNTLETSIEVYGKKMYNILDYKSGATLTMNHAIEADVVPTEGRAYGVELMLKKQRGRLNGWVGYTYARAEQRTHSENTIDQINDGRYYPANFDKPHDFTLVGNYKFSQRYSISWNVTYSTGRPITLPLARFEYGGSQRVLYADRNSYRIPDYFRTDLSFNLEGNHKIRKLAHSSWSVGVYNLTGRENPFSVYYTLENGQINGYQLSVFARPIPFVNYNFRF